MAARLTMDEALHVGLGSTPPSGTRLADANLSGTSPQLQARRHRSLAFLQTDLHALACTMRVLNALSWG